MHQPERKIFFPLASFVLHPLLDEKDSFTDFIKGGCNNAETVPFIVGNTIYP